MNGVDLDEDFEASASKCIGCGACASLVPDVWALQNGKVALLRQPASALERELAHAALVNCPALAIGVRAR